MSKFLDKNTFTNILCKLGIKAKDKLLVSSNILKIISNKKNTLTPKQMISVLKKKVTSRGTLLFPTYNWEFCYLKKFDYKKTRSLTGALSNLTLKKKEFIRSLNPIYSFTCYGKDKKLISILKHKSCFGLDSPFGYLIKNDGKQLFIGLDYKEAFSLVHVAEEKLKVDYRYKKKFNGIYIDKFSKKKRKTYYLYCRRLKKAKSTIIKKKFDLVLERNQAIKKAKFKSLNFCVVDIKKAYHLMLNDIKKRGGCIIPEKYE